MLQLLIVFFVLQGNAQLTERSRHTIDSLYPIAIDKSNPIEIRCRAYNRIGWATIYQDYHLGLKYSSEYYDLIIANNINNRIPYAAHFKGYTEMMLGDFEAANETYNHGLKVALAINNNNKVAELYCDLGNLRNTMGNTTEALIYHNKSLELAKKNELTVAQARANINIAKIYESQGNYKLSLETFQEALSICQKNKFGGYLSSIYEHLGDINIAIKEFETADKNYKKALEYSERFKNINRIIQSLNKLGKLNEELNNQNSASKYYEKALSIASINNVPALEAKVRSNLASVNLNSKKYDEALIQINTSIHLFKTFNVKEDLDEAYLIAAEVYLGLNERELSTNYYLKSYELAKKSNNINSLKNTSKGLAMAFEYIGNHEKSIKYYKEFIRYSDQKRDEDGIKEIIRLEIYDDYREKIITDSISKISEIKFLEAEYDKKEAQSNLKTYIAFSGIGILSLGLLFVGFSFLQKRKSTAILTKKNLIVRQALSDNKILLKEVHHRVKNNMQVVSSLLQLKSINTTNELAKAALLDSKNRIDSMQLAHQKMYQKGNYEQIDILDYCQDIVTMLLQPIKRSEDNFKVNGESLWIHVEQAQTLGFIVHELITNSIKYAWDNKQPKCIIITIVKNNKEIQFEYSDNGSGMPSDFNPETATSFGIRMINTLTTRQLLGIIKFKNKKGSNVNIKFDAR